MLDLSIFQNQSLRIENFSVSHSSVKPTDEFVCKKGSKQYDRFFYVTEGTIHFELDNGEKFTATGGDIVYLPNNCCYSCHWDPLPIGSHISICFVLFNNKNEVFSIGDKIELVISDSHKKHLSKFTQLYDVWLKGELGYIFKCNMLFWEFLHELFLDLTIKKLKHQHRGIYKGLLYLQNNYTTDVTPEFLASLCNMSLTSFRRQFKEVTGTSPVKYKNNLRMEKALSLLKSGEYSVTEAGISVGCPDIYYFNKMFNKAYGKNPSNFIPK